MQFAHIMLQSKGGAGKSTCCVHLAEALKDRVALKTGETLKDKLRFYDTDPSNKSFYKFKDFGVEYVNILDDDGEINQSFFDLIFSDFLSGGHDIVIDTGSSNYHDFTSYLKSNGVVEHCYLYDKHTIFHVPINYGRDYDDTIENLDRICKDFPNASVVVWSNINTTPKFEIKDFKKETQYKDNKNILGVVTLHAMKSDTDLKDFRDRLQRNLSYAQASQDPNFNIMQKMRLSKIYLTIANDINDLLDKQIYGIHKKGKDDKGKEANLSLSD